MIHSTAQSLCDFRLGTAVKDECEKIFTSVDKR